MSMLTLFRRHGPSCKGKHPPNSFTSEPQERTKGWAKCACKIYAHGTLGGVSKKLATRSRDWASAKEVIAPLEKADSWEAAPAGSAPRPPSGPQPESGPGTPLRESVHRWLNLRQTQGCAPNSIVKYRDALIQMLRFSDKVGFRFVEDWTRASMRLLVGRWAEKGNSHDTQKQKLAVLRTFFEQYVDDKVIAENPARIKMGSQTRAARSLKQKSPFSDAELERMLTGCRTEEKSSAPEVVPIDSHRSYQRLRWTDEDLEDFICLSVWTGLRISDVATFDVSKSLTPRGEAKLRAMKNGNYVCVPLPEWLAAKLRARAARIGPRIFGMHKGKTTNSFAESWRRRLKQLWSRTGPWEKKPVPHRFRHTFVRIMLEHDVPVSTIARLVGDTEAMIEKHYAEWVPGRQEATTRIVREAFARHDQRFPVRSSTRK